MAEGGGLSPCLKWLHVPCVSQCVFPIHKHEKETQSVSPHSSLHQSLTDLINTRNSVKCNTFVYERELFFFREKKCTSNVTTQFSTDLTDWVLSGSSICIGIGSS